MSHYRNTCPACGRVSQCRCMRPKEETRNPCPGCKPRSIVVRRPLPRVDLRFDQDVNYADQVVEHFEVPADVGIEDRIQRVIHEFMDDRGVQPRWLVIGWRAWVQLGWLLSKGVSATIRSTHYYGIEIVVDDDDPDVVRALPPHDRLRFGGGR